MMSLGDETLLKRLTGLNPNIASNLAFDEAFPLLSFGCLHSFIRRH
jgi:hypothetical protein